MGLFHALWWVHDLRLDNVNFAFDSKMVVYHFNKGSDDVAEFGYILNVNISVILILESLVEFSGRQDNDRSYISKGSHIHSIATCIEQLIMNKML